MEEVKRKLQARQDYLQRLIAEKEQALVNTPDGFLRICSYREHPQYYHRQDPKDLNGVYIRKSDIKTAQMLAQKDYDQKILRAAKIEYKSIKQYLASYSKKTMEQVYESLHKDRQKLITPIQETEQQYRANWENAPFQGKDFQETDPEFYTAKGERVRSKSEVMIADLLYREDIPYRYECPLFFKGTGILYPDFTILHVRLRKTFYWEHLGMMDNPDYAEQAVQRIQCYERNGIRSGDNLILTYESRKNPINQKLIRQTLLHYLK